MPRPPLSPEAVDAFRDALCDVATRRFAEHGYAGVTLRALAQELGCSATTPYRYFGSKEEILVAVATRAFEHLAARSAAAVEGLTDPVRRLEALGRAYLDYAREEPHAYRIGFEIDARVSSKPPALAKARLEAWQLMRDAVGEAVRAGWLDGDPEVVAHLLWAALHGLVALDQAGQLRRVGIERLSGPMMASLLQGSATTRLRRRLAREAARSRDEVSHTMTPGSTSRASRMAGSRPSGGRT